MILDAQVYLDIPAHLGKREYYTAPFPEGSRGAGKQFKIVPKETRLRITRQSTSGVRTLRFRFSGIALIFVIAIGPRDPDREPCVDAGLLLS